LGHACIAIVSMACATLIIVSSCSLACRRRRRQML
jgi:hypothetical protein